LPGIWLQKTAEAKCQGLLGRSSAMRLVIDELTKVAAAKDTTLLLSGPEHRGKHFLRRHPDQRRRGLEGASADGDAR